MGSIELRILATTDIHMNLSGFDYFRDRQGAGHGLAGLAPMIESCRDQRPNCLLFDNGDMLQGTALGDYAAQTRHDVADFVHPAIQVMNRLRYDAMTLGNHDFSFGCDFLTTSLTRADFPVVATNLHMPGNAATHQHLLLIRDVTDRQGCRHRLRIGILGFLPPQTTDWDKSLRPRVHITDVLPAAQAGVQALRREDPDLIVALAHSGIGAGNPPARGENMAVPLAATEGIDVVIAGHIHRSFPSPDFCASAQVDPLRGTIHGKPVVMAGFAGSHLGVIDLTLKPHGDGWRIGDFRSRTMAAGHEKSVPCTHDPDIRRILAPIHQATRQHFARPIAQSKVALHSHFALLGHDAGLQLVNQAQAWHVARHFENSDLAGLPVLSAASPARAGGRGGAAHYTNIGRGPLLLRHLADLYPFPNQIAALLVTGAALRDWLERACAIYRPLSARNNAQPLIDPRFPAYQFDIISDLDWQIDLSRPACYDANGQPSGHLQPRIGQLRHKGRAVCDDDRFILATNSYRLSDSGPFSDLVSTLRVVHEGRRRNRDILRDYLAAHDLIAPADRLGFDLLAPLGTRARFQTAPAAASQLATIARFSPAPLPGQSEGFLDLQLHL